MTKSIITVFTVTMFSLSLKSQVPRNNLNFEVLGTGLIASFNYERVFHIRENYHFAGSFGLGATVGGDAPPVPITFCYNKGKSKNFLELGLGYTAILDNDYSEHYLHSVIGYKRIGGHGFTFKARLTPIFFIEEDMREDLLVLPWAGVAFGYSF